MRCPKTLIVSMCLAAAVAAFTATVIIARREQPGAEQPRGERGGMGRWLALTPEQTDAIREADPTFDAESATLTSTLSEGRERLALLLESDTTSDTEIGAQVEHVIESHNALERRVARHLLAIRTHLSPEQRGRLMRRCAAGVRRAGRGQGCRDQEGRGGKGRGRRSLGQGGGR
ncbi:periplasmic heavy metal sensor [bacterium]|nr:periplasmic heavy metal sensor [bacterium]